MTLPVDFPGAHRGHRSDAGPLGEFSYTPALTDRGRLLS